MKKLLMLVTLLCFVVTSSVAQESDSTKTYYRWRLTTSATFAANSSGVGPSGMLYNLGAAYSLRKGNPTALEAYVGYLTDPEFSNVGFGALMLTSGFDSDLSGGGLYNCVSLGLGVISNELSSQKVGTEVYYTDLALAVKLEIGYRISSVVSIGAHITSFANMRDMSGRSFWSTGLMVGFNF